MNPMVIEKTEQDVRKLVAEWAAAERKGDSASMQRTLTDDFVGIGPRGFMLSKDEWIQRFASGNLNYESLELDEVSVRAYGDAAVVTGRDRQRVKYQNQPMDSELRIMQVWIRQQGQWRLAGLQYSPILGRP